jgi:hypothetical protein
MCYENPKHMEKCNHGVVTQGSLDLTVEEARAFAKDLLSAADAADKLYKQYEDYCDKENKHANRN